MDSSQIQCPKCSSTSIGAERIVYEHAAWNGHEWEFNALGGVPKASPPWLMCSDCSFRWQNGTDPWGDINDQRHTH
jgi:hypothetical protein